MIGALITLVIYVVVLLIPYMLFDWLVKTLPIMDPMAKILRILIVVIGVLIIVALLLNLVGVPLGLNLPRV